jgi:hypothetical protein
MLANLSLTATRQLERNWAGGEKEKDREIQK